MEDVEQRMNKKGRIKITQGGKYKGTPVATDLKSDSLVCLKNLPHRASCLLDQDGLTKAETKKWVVSRDFNGNTETDFFHTFSRSLDWGLSVLADNEALLDTLVELKSKLQVQGSIQSKNTTDLLISCKFSVPYYIPSTTATQRTISESEDMYAHLLVGNNASYKAFSITHTMIPFSKSSEKKPIQIVFDENPRLEKSLGRDVKFAFTLDSIKHKELLPPIIDRHYGYQLWLKPKITLLTNWEPLPWIFSLIPHVLSYLEVISQHMQDNPITLEKNPAVDKDDEPEKASPLTEKIEAMQDMVRVYLDMQDFRLPKED